MATSQMSEVIRHLRRAVLLRDGAGLTDGQLLEDYISRRDEAALAVLVRRHAAMVWGVCRRVLRNYHDAEDAFQATFLVLVRKAASIASPELLANWLYGVAHQTALKARATTAKRRTRERQVTQMPEPAVTEQDLWNDLQPLLDQELSRLPEKYRAAIVLCDLEGKTRKEAAQQLGVPDGTLAARLARGRVMLAKRLARHGLAVSGGTLAAVLGRNAASASAPTSVVFATIKAAELFAAGPAAATGAISAKLAALTEGVLKTMLLTKLKTVTAVLLVLGMSFAGALCMRQAGAQQGQVQEFPREGNKKPIGDGPQKPKADPDAIAWGKAVHGLQAGIRFRPGDKHSCRIGELAVFEVHLRNIGDKTIQVSYLENVFEESLPTVTDGDGREYLVRPGPLHLGDVPLVNRTLEAGQSVRIGFAMFRIQPPGWKGEVTAPTLVAGPGKYQIGIKGFPLRRGKNDRFESWSTDTVELEITARDDLPKEKPVTVPLDLPNGKSVVVPLDLPEEKPVTVPLDLAKIDRTIRKEPAYRGKPRYALLVLGLKAETRIWLVIDDKTLYVDRNGNGDLTEQGEQFLPTKVDENEYVEFHVGEIVEADGKTKHSNLIVYQYFARQFGQLVNTINVMDVAGIFGQGTSGENGCSFAATPKDAPIIHINGPMTLKAHSVWVEFRGGRKLKEVPYQLEVGEKVAQLHVQVGTPGLGKGTFAAIATEKGFPADLHPKVEISMPSKTDPKKAIKRELTLKERCCGTQFHGPVQVPEARGQGKAKVMLSFPDWKEGKVAPAVVELPMIGRVPAELELPEAKVSAELELPAGKVPVEVELPAGKVPVEVEVPAGKVAAQADDGEEPPSWANKLFEERSKEVSKPKPGEMVKHRFTMKNVYKVPLDVTRVQIVNADGATYSISNKTLQSGQAGTLEVTVDPRRIAAGKDLKIHVSVGPEYTSTATLTLKVKDTK